MKNSILLLFCILQISLFSQITNKNYNFIKSQNPIPSEILKDVHEHLEQNKEVLNEETLENKVKKKIEKRYLNYSYAVNLMFNSGVILFNDPVSIYLNKVADNLLRNDHETRSKIRIYTVRSGEVNAFTTNNGSIFLNLGLYAIYCSPMRLFL